GLSSIDYAQSRDVPAVLIDIIANVLIVSQIEVPVAELGSWLSVNSSLFGVAF
ncbi:hypothetical protein HAX54_045035, partial [Datura stramonium]|nr:hypothetical protein [Datura stramonium]